MNANPTVASPEVEGFSYFRGGLSFSSDFSVIKIRLTAALLPNFFQQCGYGKNTELPFHVIPKLGAMCCWGPNKGLWLSRPFNHRHCSFYCRNDASLTSFMLILHALAMNTICKIETCFCTCSCTYLLQIKETQKQRLFYSSFFIVA
ncbi:hypothetical protein HPP92_002586 [Vanilla planifolia]|uniref:Uncharacterized protein n=1 Tax=Vanilla planifolia TaxID=51239 RepID=A0A835S6M7_VANPL|nr:hypothetical protein HPP92_002586 [Vanilla planifolia]